MKINYKTVILSIFMLTVNFVTFALPADPNEGDTGGGDPPASIDTKLIWLAIVGIAFAYYQIKSRRNRTA